MWNVFNKFILVSKDYISITGQDVVPCKYNDMISEINFNFKDIYVTFDSTFINNSRLLSFIIRLFELLYVCSSQYLLDNNMMANIQNRTDKDLRRIADVLLKIIYIL